MARFKINNDEIKESLVGTGAFEFPKYTTQIMNLANSNAQGTRPRVVGQMSELIVEFPGRTIKEWEEWYMGNQPDGINMATAKVIEMVDKLKEAINKIDKDMVREWLKDLVIIKTFAGMKFQEAILIKLAKISLKEYRRATPEEESKGIDGYIGDKPVSIKPHTYKSKSMALPEGIEVSLVYYEKKKDGIVIEYDL